MSLLDVAALRVAVEEPHAEYDLVRDVSLAVERGETLCIVGESGSGKTVTALSIMRLLEFTSSTVVSGVVTFDGENLAAMSQDEVNTVRGRRASMIFQEAMEALNPTKRIGAQLVEAAVGLPRDDATRKAEELLGQVGIPDPADCLQKYPHQLSGGMQQRTMIAMALMCDPELLIGDEPTTALDVTIQAEILTLLVKLQHERDMAMVLITHDMGIAAEVADRVAVMYGGRLVEDGPVAELLSAPKHPYTKALLECVPRPGRIGAREMRTIPGFVPSPKEELPGCRFAERCSLATSRCTEDAPPMVELTIGPGSTPHRVACWNSDAVTPPEADLEAESADNAVFHGAEPYLELSNVSKTYARSARSENLGGADQDALVRAVDGVDLQIGKREFFCLVGESGSGKSTLGRLIARLEPVSGGTMTLAGNDVTALKGRAADKEYRKEVQIIFQDPNGSLDPRHTVAQAIAEPLKSLQGANKRDARERAVALLDEVNLPAAYVDRRPGELSGGQRQRVAIARAVATDPRLIVADEPTSALDVSVQGQIVNVLRRLQREHGLTYLMITHNLSLVLSVADRVGVLYLGKLVEVATAAELIAGPAHPYTRMLLNANPDPLDPMPREERINAPLRSLDAETAAVDRTVGCRFRDRCPLRQSKCDDVQPELTEVRPGQLAACHFPLERPLTSVASQENR